MWASLHTLGVLIALISPTLADIAKGLPSIHLPLPHLPSGFMCIEVGYHADPSDCRRFYRCVDWGFGKPLQIFQFECGVGTVFSMRRGNICTLPNDSDRPECGGNTINNNNSTTTSPPTTEIWATNGTVTNNLLQTTSQTTTTSLSTSSNQSSATSGKPGNDQGRGQCVQEGYFADVNNCRKFYRCVEEGSGNFVKHEFECGVGTVWDPDIQGCNHPWAVSREDCKEDSGTAATGSGDDNGQWTTDNSGQWTSGTGSPAQPGDATSQTGHQGQPGETTGQPASSGTPGTSGIEGSPSNPATPATPGIPGSPGTPSIPGSPGAPGTPGSPSTPGTTGIPGIPGSPSNPGTPGTPGIPGSPGIPSIPGRPGTPGTPGTSGTSDTTGTSAITIEPCNTIPGNPGTSGTPGTPAKTATPNTSGSTSGTSGSTNTPGNCTHDGFFPDPADCRKFYRCVGSGSTFIKYEFQCGTGTAWDSAIQSCNHDYLVPSCSYTASTETSTAASESSTKSTSEGTTASATIVSTQPTSDSSTETTSGITTERPKNATVCDKPGFYPDPTWCDKFYRCVDNGRGFNVYHFDCAPGTIWDPSIDTCNYPESVYPPRNCMMPLLDSTTNAVQTSSSASTESTATITESNTAPAAPTESSTAVSESSTESTSESTTGTTTEAATQSTITDSTTSSIAPTGTSTAASESSTESTSEGSSVTATVPSTQPTITDSTTSPTAPTGTSTAASESSTESTSKGTTETTTKASTEPTSESGTEITSEETTKEPNNATVCDKPGFYPDPTLCDKFYQCIDNGNGFDVKYFICATGTIFDPNIGRCNQPESVHPPRDCAMFTTTVSTTTESTTRTAETATSTTGFTTGSTTEASIPTPCPIGNLTDEQIVLICPSGFRRHPKYCNLFYQCTMENNVDIKVLVLSCPEGLIFDDQKLQCLPEDKTDQHCKGTKASARFYRKLEESSMSPIKASSEVLCPGAGHYPYKQGCSSAFYNCKQNSRGNLEGYLYKCPENFLYSSVSRRCERATRLPLCTIFKDKDKENWEERWQIPIEESNLSARSLFV